jgi:hypothetical protein
MFSSVSVAVAVKMEVELLETLTGMDTFPPIAATPDATGLPVQSIVV